MDQKPCPLMGLREDPGSHLDFPSGGNLCFGKEKEAQISLDHQEKYCLLSRHEYCHVYRASINKTRILAPVPPVQKKPHRVPGSVRQGLKMLAASMVIFVLMILGGINIDYLVSLMGNQSEWPNVNQGWLFPFVKPSLEHKSYFPFSNSIPSQFEENGVCPVPDGWTEYIAQPTDSLFRLSVLYSISEVELRMANCIPNGAPILPNQILHVPGSSAGPAPSNTTPETISINPVIPVFSTRQQEDPPEEPAQSTNTPNPPDDIAVSPTLAPPFVPTDTQIPAQEPSPVDTPNNTGNNDKKNEDNANDQGKDGNGKDKPDKGKDEKDKGKGNGKDKHP